jgi:cysteine dioxygenase
MSPRRNAPNEGLTVEDLAHQLDGLPAEEFTPDQVTAYLQEVRVRPDSLQPYVCFNKNRYTRNLIFRCSRFELLAIGWEAGQRSAIHNHAGQQCWMLVPVGKLVNQNFRICDLDEAAGTCHLQPTTCTVIDPEHPLQVDPDEPVHQVINAAADRAVSLHIYSLPYNRCLVYSLETGRYGEIALTYTTKFGKPAEQSE